MAAGYAARAGSLANYLSGLCNVGALRLGALRLHIPPTI
jgi:hypothetical protein